MIVQKCSAYANLSNLTSLTNSKLDKLIINYIRKQQQVKKNVQSVVMAPHPGIR